MFDIGGGELMLVLIAVLVFFGPKKLPELAQSLGRGLREFKKAQREFTDHINSALDQEHQKNTSTVARGASTVYHHEGPAMTQTVTDPSMTMPMDTVEASIAAEGLPMAEPTMEPAIAHVPAEQNGAHQQEVTFQPGHGEEHRTEG